MINQRYIIRKKLGQGRSKVYSVIDTEFPEKEIAMKILPSDVPKEEFDIFRQEYFTLKKLDHPNIIKSYDIGSILYVDEQDENIDAGSAYITLEKFDSVELTAYKIDSDEQKLINITKQICSALYYLHQSNYIYYDLKPQNILVAENGESAQIKIIDLGLAHYILSESENNVKGTAEYIAPELLKKEPHDHSVDLYSLGIILYNIIYQKLPFDAKGELEIYKSHIEGDFSFPPNKYSDRLIKIVKKLLEKNPNDRYSSALQVISDLNIEFSLELTKDFIPAKTLCGRQDTLNIVRTYLNDNSSNEVFSIRGFSGAGKSQVLSELNSIYPQSVYLENTRQKTGVELVRYFFHKLFFNSYLFNNINLDDQENIKQLFGSGEIEISDHIKSFVARITENKNLLLLIDDYNLYDDYSKNSINEILPILQINKIKIVIAESSEFDYAADKLFNVQTIQLTPFTDKQLSEYLDISYHQDFPKNKLRKIILDYSDLLPGSILQFIKDLLVLGVMKYSAEEVKFIFDKELEKSLSGSNEEVYRLRLSNLSNEELKVAQLISAFNISTEQIVLASILNKSTQEIEKILNNLHYKNIINSLNISNSPNIISDSFKRYIYNTISEKKKYHLIIASLIKRILPEFNIIEHARQYELAGDIQKVTELINIEIKRAENLSAYSYKKKLIEDLLLLDVNQDIRTSLQVELIRTLYKLSDFNSAIELFEKIDKDDFDENSQKELIFINGSSLIAIRKVSEGIDLLNSLLKMELDFSFRQKVLVEIAYAEFELSDYKTAQNIIMDLLNNSAISDEEKGRCYNLLGMIKVYSDGDLNSAIQNFHTALKFYEKAQLPRRVAGVEVNLGNIYNMIGEDDKSEMHWDNALKINESIGNLEQEAIILLNFGTYYRHKLNFEKSLQFVSRSEIIFSSLGNENYRAIVLINMGQILSAICEYQKSYECIKSAISVFRKTDNIEEEANALFDLGILFLKLNNFDRLEQIISEYEILLTTHEYLIKHKTNISYLKKIEGIQINEARNFIELLNEYLQVNEKRNYLELLILFLDKYVSESEFYEDSILNLLFSDIILDEIPINNLLNGYREYFLGRISAKVKDKRLSPPIEHFEKALSIIENENITELTWKVLLAISEVYIERGFINKAKKPLIYASELVNYIADKIKKSDLRTKYLGDKERKKVFENLKLVNTPHLVQ